MNKQHIILYQKNVSHMTYIPTLLFKDKEMIIHHIKDFNEMEEYLHFYQIHCLLYECEIFKKDNLQDIRSIENMHIPYLIIASEIADNIHLDSHKVLMKSKEDSQSSVFFNNLIVKIKSMYIQGNKIYKKEGLISTNVIGIGASIGGPQAILEILKGLPTDLAGIVIVQHMSDANTESFAHYLNDLCQQVVKVGKENEVIKNGVVYIAKSKRHLTIERQKDGYHLRYKIGEKVNCVCPSIDVLFESMAKQIGVFAVGILLTGMGNDGAIGLKAMKDVGAVTIIQNKETCALYGMPKEAKKINAHQKELSLQAMSRYLINYFNQKEKGDMIS